MRKAAKWLQAALDAGEPFARLYLSHLTEAGKEDAALPHLKVHLSEEHSGMCSGDVTLAAGVGRRGARTRRCSRAAAAV